MRFEKEINLKRETFFYCLICLFVCLFGFALCNTSIWINSSLSTTYVFTFSFFWRWSTYQRWRKSRPWWCTRVIQRDCSLAPPQHQGLLSPTAWYELRRKRGKLLILGGWKAVSIFRLHWSPLEEKLCLRIKNHIQI